jgi:hypothetical protein
MSRITDIINNVRIDLGDTNSTRYSNDILIRHLNSAINDFVMATKCLKERIYVGLNYSSAIYDLRPYALDFIRAEYLGRAIEAKSFSDLDLIDHDWQSAIGTEVQYIAFDNLNKGMFRVYPRVEGAIDIISQNSLYGGLIDITIGDDDYQIPSLEDIDSNLAQYIVVYVVKKPNKVTINTLDSALEINSLYDNALEKYITAMCLRSDTDANNRAYGNEQLQLYSNYVTSAKNSESLANNRVVDRVIKYRGGF